MSKKIEEYMQTLIIFIALMIVLITLEVLTKNIMQCTKKCNDSLLYDCKTFQKFPNSVFIARFSCSNTHLNKNAHKDHKRHIKKHVKE